jgi:hypothetical protein
VCKIHNNQSYGVLFMTLFSVFLYIFLIFTTISSMAEASDWKNLINYPNSISEKSYAFTPRQQDAFINQQGGNYSTAEHEIELAKGLAERDRVPELLNEHNMNKVPIKIAIVDSSLAMIDTHPELKQNVDIFFRTGSTYEPGHAYHVASIVKDMIPDALLYMYEGGAPGDLDHWLHQIAGHIIGSGCKVVNMSFSMSNDGSIWSKVKFANFVKLMASHKIITVISSRNRGQSLSDTAFFKELKEMPDVLNSVIFALSHNSSANEISYFSNYPGADEGIQQASVAAPGESIRSGGITKTGTSMAAPMIAGTLALMMREYPLCQFSDPVGLLKNSLIKHSNPEKWGAGRLDVTAALRAASVSHERMRTRYNINSMDENGKKSIFFGYEQFLVPLPDQTLGTTHKGWNDSLPYSIIKTESGYDVRPYFKNIYGF